MSITSNPNSASFGPDYRAADYNEFLGAIQRSVDSAPAGPLFTTDAGNLFQMYVALFPNEEKQHYTCTACRHFLERFGGLATIEADGLLRPLLWSDAVNSGSQFSAILQTLRQRVNRAQVTGVFYSSDMVWGQPFTPPWHHMAVKPRPDMVYQPTFLKNATQAMAEKLEEFKMLQRGLSEYSLSTARQAEALLKGEALYRADKVTGIAEWFVQTHEMIDQASRAARNNVLWKLAATAPTGFCHIRSTMIGTLLDDLQSGMHFSEVKRRFAEKMDPMKYQRPQVAPAAGNIRQANRIIEEMGLERSLHRRYAQLSDLETLWMLRGKPLSPRPGRTTLAHISAVPIETLRSLLKKEGVDPAIMSDDQVRSRYRNLYGFHVEIEEGTPLGEGVFGHVQPKAKVSGAPQPPAMSLPQRTMTWSKFRDQVLPHLTRIQIFAKNHNDGYGAFLTALHADAPPILQWDQEGQRNPVSWYHKRERNFPYNWNLAANEFHEVEALVELPPMWYKPENFRHHGEAVFFVIRGCRDLDHITHNGLFPEMLKDELRPVRSTIEAFAATAGLHGRDQQTAGIRISKGEAMFVKGPYTLKVMDLNRVESTILLDRWD